MNEQTNKKRNRISTYIYTQRQRYIHAQKLIKITNHNIEKETSNAKTCPNSELWEKISTKILLSSF